MREQVKSRSLLIRVGSRLRAKLRSNIGGLLMTVLLLGGIGAGLFTMGGITPGTGNREPTNQANSFMHALMTHDGNALAETLSPSFRASLAAQTGALGNANAE